MFFRKPVTFVNAQVVAADGRLGRTLRIRRGSIDGIDVAPDKGDVVVDLDGSFVFPGLINAHDHLELNSQARLKWRDRYANASEWIADFQPRFATDPALAVTKSATLDERVWVGGLKNLLAGVTTVCHHNPMHRVLRRRFPVRVVERFGFSHSLHVDGDAVTKSHRRTPGDWPWMIHAAEGVDAPALPDHYRSQRLGGVTANTVLIHGVPFGDAAERVIAAGAGLVWCPSSNQFLFETTADVRAFDDADRLALGSDSRLSGERDLLDEMKVAHATRQLSAEGVARTVTSGAAKLLRSQSCGRIDNGVPADLTVIRAIATCPFDTLVAASRGDVRLTVIDGKPAIGEPVMEGVFAATAVGFSHATLDGADRIVARWITDHVSAMHLQEPGFQVPSHHRAGFASTIHSGGH
jgi:cytosine/adenosine deaminase-related metal-dependent hydrolase